MTDIERSIRRTRKTRVAVVLLAVLNALALAWNVASGSALAFVPAACIAALLVLIVVQTRLIGILQRTRHLNWRADQLELAAKAVRENAQRSCAHANAEPVDLLLTGERVAWVCPDCNAELPAGWSPSVTVPAAVLSLSGAGAISARELSVPAAPVGEGAPMTGPGGRWRPLSELPVPGDVAAEHFAALARVGRESCVSFCPICADRGRRETRPHGRSGGTGQMTVVHYSGTADSTVAAGGGGGSSASVWQPEPPEGAHDYHLDGAGREWYRDAGDLWWIKPAPDSPWYRQDTTEGGGQR